jgi:hypothetical protein
MFHDCIEDANGIEQLKEIEGEKTYKKKYLNKICIPCKEENTK